MRYAAPAHPPQPVDPAVIEAVRRIEELVVDVPPEIDPQTVLNEVYEECGRILRGHGDPGAGT